MSWSKVGATALLAMAGTGCSPVNAPAPVEHAVIPVPVLFETLASDSFLVTGDVPIVVDADDDEAIQIGLFLAHLIGNSAETTPEVIGSSSWTGTPSIRLTREGADAELGAEGYSLTSGADGVTIVALQGAGLFYGVQTLRQLLPWFVEYEGIQDRPMAVPWVRISDTPRYEWRGVMLDVARHFFEPRDVKRVIDLAALYKINRLHLHLSDDQGWRVEIPGWPRLTEVGGSLEVGGGPGGYYTSEEYADLVRYAEARFVTIVPEIDLPGHTNAALASYAELNCDGIATELYTGIEVGFSTLCVESEETFRFIDDVVRELSAATPGPYFHIGGDEVEELTTAEYASFMARVYPIVRAHGKRVVGWDEIAATPLEAGTLVQLWRPFWDTLDDLDSDSARLAFAEAQAARVGVALEAGARLILSPADRVYLDMKYNESTVLGLDWAGGNDVRDSYGLGTATWLRSLPDEVIAGVEAPLWSETTATIDDVEFMLFPRLAGVAEFGWSRESDRGWDGYRNRVSRHGRRWSALGVNFNRSELLPW